jgi:RNA-directed DNA polymerase
MGKGGSVIGSTDAGKESSLNNDAPWPGLVEANARVLDHQRKLHRWSKAEPARRFDDVFNLVCDRATIRVAWERVARNRGAAPPASTPSRVTPWSATGSSRS